MTVTFVDADVSIARRIRGSTSRLFLFLFFQHARSRDGLSTKVHDKGGNLRYSGFMCVFFFSFFLFSLFSFLSRLVLDNRWTRSFPKFQWNRVCSVLVTPRLDLFFVDSHTAECNRPVVSSRVLAHMYL